MTTYERLLKVANTVFDGEIDTARFTPDASLREDMGINSIGMLYMAMALEEEFSIKFRNEDLTNLKKVSDVIACIESKK